MSSTPKNSTTAERIRKRRSIAIALTLALMVVAFYVATFVRFGNAIAERSM